MSSGKPTQIVSSSSAVRNFLTAAAIAAVCLTSCQSKASIQKHREKILQIFATKVVQQVLDRNPATIHESMTTLTHEELEDKLVDKLQTNKIMPETDIDVLRIVEESKAKHVSNRVDVSSVTFVGDAEKDVVPVKVVGKNVKVIDGKDAESKDFAYTITCKLTTAMEDYPRAIDFTGETPVAEKPAAEKAAAAPSKNVRKHRRR